MDQVRGTPWHIIALALLAMFTGYAALIGYDWSALRYIGKKLPFPVVATGGFLGYALGNTLGAGPVTGGAVRDCRIRGARLPPICSAVPYINQSASPQMGRYRGFDRLTRIVGGTRYPKVRDDSARAQLSDTFIGINDWSIAVHRP